MFLTHLVLKCLHTQIHDVQYNCFPTRKRTEESNSQTQKRRDKWMIRPRFATIILWRFCYMLWFTRLLGKRISYCVASAITCIAWNMTTGSSPNFEACQLRHHMHAQILRQEIARRRRKMDSRLTWQSPAATTSHAIAWTAGSSTPTESILASCECSPGWSCYWSVSKCGRTERNCRYWHTLRILMGWADTSKITCNGWLKSAATEPH